MKKKWIVLILVLLLPFVLFVSQPLADPPTGSGGEPDPTDDFFDDFFPQGPSTNS